MEKELLKHVFDWIPFMVQQTEGHHKIRIIRIIESLIIAAAISGMLYATITKDIEYLQKDVLQLRTDLRQDIRDLRQELK